MDIRTLELGEAPHLRFELVEGDLTLRGREGGEIEVRGESGELTVEEQEGGAVILCRSDCQVMAPTGARVDIRKVGGDARLEGIAAVDSLDNVGGDLHLERTGASSVKRVGGDLHAKDILGDLGVQRVGGDARIDGVGGAAAVGAVGGDLVVRAASAVGDVTAGGDVHLEYTPVPGSRTKATAGGDVTCRFPSQPSLMLAIRAGGDIRVPGATSKEWGESGFKVTLGAGEAELQIFAGGDVWVRAGDRTDETFEPGEVGDLIASKVAGKIEDMEARLDAMGVEVHGLDATRLGDRIQRLVNRAMRRTAAATEKADQLAQQYGAFGLRFAQELAAKRGEGGAAGEPVSDEERLTILRMLEEGKITVSDAERLLDALG